MMRSSLGEDHLNVALNLRTQAAFYAEQGKYEEAVHLVERALQIQEESLPRDSPVTGETRAQLARLYEKTGKLEAAGRLRKQLNDAPDTPPQE